MSAPAGADRRRDRGALLAVACVTFLVFAFTLRLDFVATWDDGIYILGNENIRQLSLATVGWAITAVQHLWAPVTWLSFAVDHAIWGLDPFGFHLTNAVCHALAAGLVAWLALEVLQAASPGLPRRTSRVVALAAALVWALHPLRVESVAWVSERKDVLSGLLGLLAVLAYLGYARSPAGPGRRWGAYGLALACYALSLGAKSALVTLPLALLLLDWVPLRRFGAEGLRALLLEKLPFFLLAGVVTAITFVPFQGAGLSLQESGLESRALIALRSTWDYLGMSLWPSGLSPFYLHPIRASLQDPAFLLPSLGTLALTAAALWQARRRPALAATWLAYLVLLAPGLMATQVSDTAMADRFTYLPAIPLTLLLAAGLGALADRVRAPAGLAVAGAVALGVLVTLSVLTVRQISYWQDDVTLWTRAIDVRPHFSGRIYFMRATAHEQRGDLKSALVDVDEALAIATAKRYGRLQDLHTKRARIRKQAGDLAGALADYSQALATESSPDLRAMLLAERAEVHRGLGQADLADEDLRQAAPPAQR
ncbi:MAG: tetratricopeptide repeat protein [Anaeromyxobacter sp.]|nr:tetratricopeptide repeat protein [Anaeromyxobacter sp.]